MNDFIPLNESTEIVVIEETEVDITETHFSAYQKEDIIKYLTRGYSPFYPEVIKDEMIENILKVLDIPDVKDIKIVKSLWSDGGISWSFKL